MTSGHELIEIVGYEFSHQAPDGPEEMGSARCDQVGLEAPSSAISDGERYPHWPESRRGLAHLQGPRLGVRAALKRQMLVVGEKHSP